MPNTSLKIYIAGPYSDKQNKRKLTNVTKVIDAAIDIFKKGHLPYVPHLTHYVDDRAKEIGESLTWDDYMRWHDCWLNICDAFLYLESSKGTDIELGKAKKAGIKIFKSINEIPFANK